MTLHYLTMFLSGINIAVLVLLLLRYSGYRQRRIPALNYGLAMIVVSVVFGALTTVAHLLPQGPALLFIEALIRCSSLWLNTFFLLMVFVLTARPGDTLLRFQRVLLYIPAALSLLSLTNNWHHLMVQAVVKQTDGFLYETQLGILSLPVTLYTLVLSIIAVVRVFRSGSAGIIQSAGVRWLLVLTTMLPTLFSFLGSVVPLLGQLNIGVVLTWVPLVIITYLFFGYHTSSRNMAMHVMDEAYVVFDLRGFCVDINHQGLRFFGQYTGTERPHANDFARLAGVAHLPGLSEREIALEAPGEETRYYQISSFALSNGLNQYCGNGYIIREVTEFRQKMNQLNTMATEDPLTGAKNRRYLEEHAVAVLNRARQNSRPLTALMLDIDFFKRVNDVHGHLAGDEVLSAVYSIFQQNVREQDVVFRYGGEEFLILCEGLGREDAQRLAERIRTAVEAHTFQTSAGDVRITISAGLHTTVPTAQDTMKSLVDAADQLLYQAKQNGRNRVELAAV